MAERRLIGKRNVTLESEREMVLEYYVLKEEADDNEEVTYGAMIRKTDDEKAETETVEGITHSNEVIQELTELLMEHIVTPIGMVDVIDDYVTEKLCS